MHARRMVAMLTAALGGAAACSPNAPRSGIWGVEPPRRTVTVRNDNWLDVTVYVVRNGARYRLGTVGAMASETLRIPLSLLVDDTVRLMVDPIGSNATYTSDQMVVSPGQRVELTVHNSLSMSTFAVWDR